MCVCVWGLSRETSFTIFFCLWAWRARETSVRGGRVCKDGHQSAKYQWGIKTDGFQHGKVFVRMASLQKEIARKVLNSKTKSESKCETKSLKNSPKRPRKMLCPVQLPESFSPELFHNFPPAISNQISNTISNIFSQRIFSAGMATLSFCFLKTRHFGTRLLWYPFGCLFSGSKRGIKTDGYQNGKLF